MEHFLKFDVGKFEFFVPIRSVIKVLPAATIRQYPADLSGSLMGYIILEGEPVAVIDLHYRMGLKFDKLELSHKMILMTWNGFKFIIIAEEVSDVIELDPEDFSNFAMNTYTKGSLLIDSTGKFIINDIGSFIKEDVLINLNTGKRILGVMNEKGGE